jgi:uncharacterized protein (TIGR03437 family)
VHHVAAVRAAASLDELAREPRNRAFEAAGVQPREIFEPERAIRRRNSASLATTAVVGERASEIVPAAAQLVPPAFSGFLALPDNFTAIPPDTMGAVGPQHVVTMLNTQVLIQSRTGVARSGYPITLNAFWSPLGTFTGSGSTFDPRILYDAAADRWIATADVAGESASSALLVAVTQTGDPGGKWNYYKIDVGEANLWGDFPSTGFNANWVAVSMNMFRIKGTGAYVSTNVCVFSKADLYSASGTGSHSVFNDNQGEFTVAVDRDNSSPNTLYLVQAFPVGFGPIAGSGSIRVSTVTGAVGSETFGAGSGGFLNVADPWADTGPGTGDFGPQASTTTRIDTGDSRLTNCVLRGGSIWCAHTIYLPANAPTRAAAQWFQISPSTTPATLMQRGRIDDPTGTYHYAYPSIAVNKNGDALIGYTRFGETEYATAEFSYRASTDPPNTMQPETLIKFGEASYVSSGARTGSNRWGDYSTAMADPANDLNFWTIQEYAATPPSSRSGAFGTWWAQVIAPSAGLNCTYTVSAAAPSFDLAGGSDDASVTTGNGCPWQAAANTDWISIATGSPGVGSGTVHYTVASNSAGRSGTITIAGQTITVTQSAPSPTAPTFTTQAVVNAASFKGSGVAPGELVTVFGSGLGPGVLQKPMVNSAGVVDMIAGGTRVLFDGVAAPMIYSLSGQISAVAPFSLQGRTSTQVQVEYLGTRSAAVTVPVVASAPAIFTADSSGKGQGAILNQDFSVNGASNPASAGSAIAIYMTGAGAMQSPVTNGALARGTVSVAQDVTVRIGGVPVKPLYAGAAPGIVQGVVQINAVVPAGVTGNVALDLTIGGVTSPAVTVAVK